MDSSKAQKAKSKAKSRTQQQKGQAEALMQQQMLNQAAMSGAGINPELQAQQIAMQDQTQMVNPYHMMGALAPNYYNPGNVIGGGHVPGC